MLQLKNTSFNNKRDTITKGRTTIPCKNPQIYIYFFFFPYGWMFWYVSRHWENTHWNQKYCLILIFIYFLMHTYVFALFTKYPGADNWNMSYCIFCANTLNNNHRKIFAFRNNKHIITNSGIADILNRIKSNIKNNTKMHLALII